MARCRASVRGGGRGGRIPRPRLIRPEGACEVPVDHRDHDPRRLRKRPHRSSQVGSGPHRRRVPSSLSTAVLERRPRHAIGHELGRLIGCASEREKLHVKSGPRGLAKSVLLGIQGLPHFRIIQDSRPLDSPHLPEDSRSFRPGEASSSSKVRENPNSCSVPLTCQSTLRADLNTTKRHPGPRYQIAWNTHRAPRAIFINRWLIDRSGFPTFRGRWVAQGPCS